MVVQDIFNDYQELLPGLGLKAEFYDDKCDAVQANRATLLQCTGSNEWVGVGGMGRSIVCESLSAITSPLFMPTLSFECTEGSTLSDTTLFADFVRFGSRRTLTGEIVGQLTTRMTISTPSSSSPRR